MNGTLAEKIKRLTKLSEDVGYFTEDTPAYLKATEERDALLRDVLMAIQRFQPPT